MDFGFSEEQDMLRQVARDFLAEKCPTTFVRQMMEDEKGYSADLWNEMAGYGWLGMTFPEAYGGQGLGFVDLMVVLEEMGAVLLPSPYISSVILAGQTILIAGSEAQKQEYLPKIADGSLIATLAMTEPSGRFDAEGISDVRALPADDGFQISGTKLFVTDAHVSDLMVVAARTKDAGDKSFGVTLFLVDSNTAGITVNLLETMDQTRKQCEVVFDQVNVSRDRVLGQVDMGWPVLQKVLNLGCAALCAEMVGGAQRVLDISVDYAKERVQFGRPIGSFQAIKHKCAEMMLQVESAKSAAYYAAWAVDEDVPEAPLAVSMAKAYCSDAYRHTAGEGIQVHGGIGFTWEHDMHLYFKRAKYAEFTFGDATYHRELVAQEINL
ncbi:MAG: acyl-CoA dehydrogenase [Candidatus Entotheonella factor]|uniref:Acyl-CoA dehydrogenase n=1 Tax=Entotheonella factor TaxID=1429438 RepID=W4L760_ENTF1|nr:MAG: acyl-CoA dehydrogenase [Candidatus Entotheonella factor]